MSDLKREARDALENAREKAGNIFENIKDKAVEWKDKAAPAVENLKDKAVEWKDKAVPAVENLKDKAVDAVKQGAGRVRDRASSDVKNDFFNDLDAEARQQKAGAQQEAEAMQRRLEALLRGEADAAPDAEEPDEDATREE